MLGAGSPLAQLGLGEDDWRLHQAVLRRAVVLRREELKLLSPRDVQWLPPPSDLPEDEDDQQDTEGVV